MRKRVFILLTSIIFSVLFISSCQGQKDQTAADTTEQSQMNSDTNSDTKVSSEETDVYETSGSPEGDSKTVDAGSSDDSDYEADPSNPFRLTKIRSTEIKNQSSGLPIRTDPSSSYSGTDQDEDDRTIISLKRGPEPRKELTIIVYMVGSTLEYDDSTGFLGYASDDLSEMMGSGFDSSEMNVIVYTGGCNGWYMNIPAGQNCFIDTSSQSIVAYTEQSLNMGDPQTLVDCISYCEQQFPSDEYGLIFWDHGSGWQGFGMDVRHDGDILNLPEMKLAMSATDFSQTHHLAFVGFDACLMAGAENAMVWKDYADYLVASEESELGYGWDYSSLSSFDTGNIQKSLQNLVKQSGETLAATGSPTTLSIMDLSKADQLEDALNSMFSEAAVEMARGEGTEIQQGANQTKEFGVTGDFNYDLLDLYDFADHLSLSGGQEESVKSAVDDLIVDQYTNMERVHGVSIYYPLSQLPDYVELFEQGYGWDDMYYAYVCPADSYLDYLDAYVRFTEGSGISGSGEADSDAGDQSGSTDSMAGSTDSQGDDSSSENWGTEDIPGSQGGTESSDNNAVVQLTPEQRSEIVSVYYNIYIDTTDADGESYRPLKLACAVEPDADGRLFIPDDPWIITAVTDEMNLDTPWTVREIENNNGRAVYDTVVTYLQAGPDFQDLMTDQKLSVCARIAVDENGSTELLSFSASSSEAAAAGKNTIDLSRWEGISQSAISYTPTKSEGGAILPFSEWETGGFIGWNSLPMEDGFTFRTMPASSFNGQLVCQFVATGAHGEQWTTGLIPMDTGSSDNGNNMVSIETPKGELAFQLFDGYAVLSSYSGDDSVLELPSEAGGLPVTMIGPSAIAYAPELSSLVISEGIQELGIYSVRGCQNLQTVSLPSTITDIDMNAFQDDGTLFQIYLPEGLRHIGRCAFKDCTSLTDIAIPSSLQSMGAAVFSGCTGLKTISLDGENNACIFSQNLLLSKDGATLLCAPVSGSTYIKIPEGVTEIAYGAFAGCEDIKMVDMPASLKRIDSYSFYGCSGLVNLSIPDGVSYIGTEAFGGNRFTFSFFGDENGAAIDTVHLGSGLEELGERAFDGIQAGAFELSGSDNYQVIDGFITNAAGDYILEAPQGLGGSVSIPSGISGFSRRAFESNDHITDIYIPDSVTFIPDVAFSHSYDNHSNPVYSIIIHGKKGSYAEDYAQTRNITFVEE